MIDIELIEKTKTDVLDRLSLMTETEIKNAILSFRKTSGFAADMDILCDFHEMYTDKSSQESLANEAAKSD